MRIRPAVTDGAHRRSAPEPAGCDTLGPRRMSRGTSRWSGRAWAAALTKPDLALVILMAGLIAAYAVDRTAVALRWFPDWYGILRKYLTAIAIASLGASLMRVMT